MIFSKRSRLTPARRHRAVLWAVLRAFCGLALLICFQIVAIPRNSVQAAPVQINPAFSQTQQSGELWGHRRIRACGYLQKDCSPMPGEEPVVYVTTGDDLKTLVETAAPGTTFVLEGGDHGTLNLANIQSDPDNPITITSADPADPAVFANMSMKNVTGLTVEGVTFDHTFDPSIGTKETLVSLQSCSGVTLRDVLMDGDIAHGVSEAADGYPTGFGFWAKHCDDITVENSEIRGFYKGLVFEQSSDLNVTGNDLHSVRSDGMNFIDVHGAVIEDNHIHDFIRSPASGDHMDMIQFWTNGQAQASSDIVIRGNFLDVGEGNWTQSLFMRNEEVDNGRAGAEMFYRNVLIEENVILNSHLHGITVGATDGLVVRNNSLLRSEVASEDLDKHVSSPQLRIWGDSRNVNVADNVVAGVEFGKGPGSADWAISNTVILDPFAAQGVLSYAEALFNTSGISDGDVGALMARPDSIIVSSGAGATALHYTPQGDPDGDGLNALADLILAPGTANQLMAGAGATMADPTALSGAAYQWDFGDGTSGNGRDVSHVYAAAGTYDVTLSVTLLDGTTDTFRQQITIVSPEVLSFDNATGNWIWFGGETAVSGLVPLDDSAPAQSAALAQSGASMAMEIGDGHGVRSLAKSMIAPFFGSDAFDLSLSLQALPGGSSGEVLRIHDSLVMTVLSDGSLRADVYPDTGERLRMTIDTVDMFDGAWHDITLSFDGASDLVSLTVDGTHAKGLTTAGTVRDMGHHGLYFGNPWGKANFDGLVKEFSLASGSAAMVPPYQDDILEDDQGTWIDPSLWTQFAGETLGDMDEAQPILSDVLPDAPLETVFVADLPQVAGTETDLGRLVTFEDEAHVGFSITLSGLDTLEGGGVKRVLWNHMKYGLEISETGIGLRIGLADGSMKRFWASTDTFDFDLNQQQVITAELDADADIASLWLGDTLILEVTGKDLVFGEADAYQWGWTAGGAMGRLFEGTVENLQAWSYESNALDLLL